MPALYVFLMNGNISRRILHILYPTRCPVCGDLINWNDSFCKICTENLSHFQGEFSIPGTDGSCAAFKYDDSISSAIFLLKNGVCGNADFALGKALAEKIKVSGFADDIELIIPVPVHKITRRKRGYNQAQLLSLQVGQILGIKVSSNAVVKSIFTEQQKQLSAKERKENLRNSFSVVKPEIIRNKNILLIDDVCTTGSTLEELTRTLKAFEPKKIYCGACCKTKLKKP